MKLYHGSKLIVKNPTSAGSKSDNDYGSAFYCTLDVASAHEWACRSKSVGYVNEYELKINGLKILDLTDKDKYLVLNWVAILLHFRNLDNSFVRSFNKRLEYIENNYYIDVKEYDLVIGYRADDAYFRFPLEFVRGNITLSQLERSFKLGELSIQYVITSDKGISNLKFIKPFLSEEKYINRYFDNVKKATERLDALDKDEDGIRIFDLMRN